MEFDDRWWFVVLVHVLFYPLYQVLSTLRHELSHAVAAWLSGVRVTEFKIFPHRRNGELFFGWIGYDPEDRDRQNGHMSLAPYYVDVLCIVACIVMHLCGVIRSIEDKHVFTFVVVMLVVSPAVDIAYHWFKYLKYNTGDFARANVLFGWR